MFGKCNRFYVLAYRDGNSIIDFSRCDTQKQELSIGFHQNLNASKYVIEKSILFVDRRAYPVGRSGTEVSKKMLKTKILIIVDIILETYIFEKLILYVYVTLCTKRVNNK